MYSAADEPNLAKMEDHVSRLASITATDWRFQNVAEFDSQVSPRFYSAGMRLFCFDSRAVGVSAFILFGGAGPGAGFKFSWSNETLHLALNSVEALSRPGIGKEIRLSIPRRRASALTMETLSVKTPFSLDDLNGASGLILAGGAGAGIGIGALVASASLHGQELFRCERIGLEFGRLGGSVSSLSGFWYVAGAWNR